MWTSISSAVYAVAILAAAVGLSVDAVTTSAADESSAATRISQLANAFRATQHLPPVSVNRSLTDTAHDFARYLAQTDKFSHTADDKQPRERVQEHGYEACIVAENIGAQFDSDGFAAGELARRLVEGWKASETHRSNMLDPDVTETGVGIAHSEKSGRYYAVQLFGRPKSQAIVVQIENRAGAAVAYKVGEQTLRLEPQGTRTHLLCRSSDLRFWPAAAEEDKTQATPPEHVNSATRLVIESGPANALVVKRQPEKTAER